MYKCILFFSVILLSFSFTIQAQDAEQRQQLQLFSQGKHAEWQQQRLEAEAFAERTGIPVRKVLDDGRVIELQLIKNGIPIYYQTHNAGAAITSSVDALRPGGDLGLSLTGISQTLGVWDGGAVRTSHQEFSGRATQKDDANTDDPNFHATHVAGTMIAEGIDPEARGMSYEADLFAHDWNDDLSEVADAALEGVIASNHSYGRIFGWHNSNGTWRWYGDPDISETEDYRYGFYTEHVESWDELALNAPHILIVQSAGNSRFEGPDQQPINHEVWDSDQEQWVSSSTVRDLDGAPNGYQSMGGRALAKNVLTVGAVSGIEGGYEFPGDVQMSSFSSWGPTDDGRIKPEIVSKGVSVYSTLESNDSDYGSMSGTSMAAPVVSGAAGLLYELYEDENDGNTPLASTIRALLIHTAYQPSLEEGPSYEFGWGLMNAGRAAEVLSTANANDGHVVEENTLDNNEEFTHTLQTDGENALRATISWNDPAGTPPDEALNPTDLMLVNDLDLRIEDPNQVVHEPYILDPANPDQPATTGDNFRDNTEQVFIEDPIEGEYTITVTHKGQLAGGEQDFSLIITDTDDELYELPFAGGDGTPENPYEVGTPNQLDEVRNFMEDHFRQINNINLSGFGDFEPIGEKIPGDSPANFELFEGEYNGDGFTISNLTIDMANEEKATGLFAGLSSSATIHDLTITDAEILNGVNRVGILTGFNWEGTIENVSVSGIVNGDHTSGGLAGRNVGGVILNSSADVNVTGSDNRLGGLAGANQGGTIENSHANGDVESTGGNSVGGLVGSSFSDSNINRSYATGNATGELDVGGLVGRHSGATITESFATGNVEATSTSFINRAGGLVGVHWSGAEISDSYALGNVDAANYDAGGLVGRNASGADIHRSYSTGHVSGSINEDRIGGLIGYDVSGGTVSDSYWDLTNSDQENSDGGTGLTYQEMMEESSFSGFSFGSTWAIDEFNTYPYLVENEADPLPSPPASVAIEGEAGWRMLSMPAQNTPVSVLAEQNLVQGVPGANAFYEDDYPGFDYESYMSNLYYFDPAAFNASDSDPTGWEVPENFDHEFASGEGFIWYFYDNDIGPSQPLDEFTLLAYGTAPVSDVTVTMSASDEWVLVGNPFKSNLDAGQLDGSGLESDAAQVWDANDGSFVIVGFNPGERISTWQGFFVENNGSEDFTIPASARTTDETDFHSPDSDEQMLTVDFKLEGENDSSEQTTTDKALSLVFDDNAVAGWDPLDVRKLIPMTNSFATLAFVGERDGSTIYKARESQPSEIAGTIEIPMKLELSEMSGKFELSWSGITEIEETTEIRLIDHQDGVETDLRESESYTFYAESEDEQAQRTNHEGHSEQDGSSNQSGEDGPAAEYRFTMILNQPYTSSEPDPDLPQEVALQQNYPNPFNPDTQIRFELPESKEVQLEVFNVQGQRVATLVNETRPAGEHQVTFDAGSLASGVYLYRLRAGSTVLTNKMMLVK